MRRIWKKRLARNCRLGAGRWGLLALGWGLVVFLTFPLQAQSFRVAADHVRVPVTVVDETGQNVLGLSREDFLLLDEGKRRPIENFVLDQAPIHAIILIDASGSVREELDELKKAAREFAEIFDRSDRIAVMGFADELETLQDWTNSQRRLRNAVGKLERGYRTALYDSLLKAARTKLEDQPGKKVIILLTDGLDNESDATYESVLNQLVASDISLYIISRTRMVASKVAEAERVEFLNRVMKNVLDDDKDFVDIYFETKETAMNHLAEASGGRALYPVRLQDLAGSYSEIARELKNQYLLTFKPPASSHLSFRKIEVRCKRPVGNVYHRELYRHPDPTP